MLDKGAHFYKCDFQVHSPRDLNWSGRAPSNEQERIELAEEYIKACRQKALDAIAISDHHDLVFYSYVKRASENETDDQGKPLPKDKRVVIFPAMELTLGVPCQALLILDADFPESLLEQIPRILSVTQTDSKNPKHAQVKRLEHIASISQLCEILDQQDFLKGRYIVLPNIGENGEFSIIRKGLANRYKEMPCVGGYVDGSISKLGKGKHDIINGISKEWGNKSVAIIQTSDARSRDFKALGEPSSWIKWSTPTAEALRQACLAKESRISHTAPSLPQMFITSIQISNSKFLGPVDLKFNPQYNALIGGRGTGKSTILEYLRWGVADQPTNELEDEVPAFQAKRKSLIDKTLLKFEAVATVTFTINGIPHVVRRSTKSSDLQVKIGENDFRACDESEVRNLLPIQAYSQKQLSNVGIKSDELVRFIEAPIRKQLTNVREELRGVGADIKRAYVSVQSKRSLDNEIQKYSLELQSLNTQVESLKKSITGLSPADRDVLAKHTMIQQEDSAIRSWSAEIKNLSDAAKAFAARANAASLKDQIDSTWPNERILGELKKKIEELFSSVSSDANKIANLFDKDHETFKLNDVKSDIQSWSAAKNENQKLYEEAKTRSTMHETTLKQITESELRIKTLNDEIAERTQQLVALGDPLAEYSRLVERWKIILEGRSTTLESECEKLTESSNGFIQAIIIRTGKNQHIQKKLIEVFKGAKIQGDKIEVLFTTIVDSKKPLDDWMQLLAELEQLSLCGKEGIIEGDLPHTPILDRANLTDEQKRRATLRLTEENWLDIALSDIEDVPKFEYKVREGEYIRFEDASAGQQATALMYVLLNQEGPPLIIDQPEDDLDSGFISEIISELWKSKTRRQLIFASHNANLVVNGDAELVVCCEYTNEGDQTMGKVSLQGAIDLPIVREKITSVMEGGPAAFKLRKDKYGF